MTRRLSLSAEVADALLAFAESASSSSEEILATVREARARLRDVRRAKEPPAARIEIVERVKAIVLKYHGNSKTGRELAAELQRIADEYVRLRGSVDVAR